MEQQKAMEESFARAHREFINNLGVSIDLLAKDIDDAAHSKSCTAEWCRMTENVLDDLAKMVYSISEPRWLSDEDSRRISSLRHRVHDIYAQYKNVQS